MVQFSKLEAAKPEIQPSAIPQEEDSSTVYDSYSRPVAGFFGRSLWDASITLGAVGFGHALAPYASAEYARLVKGRLPGGSAVLCAAAIMNLTAATVINTSATEGASIKRYVYTHESAGSRISVYPFGVEFGKRESDLKQTPYEALPKEIQALEGLDSILRKE